MNRNTIRTVRVLLCTLIVAAMACIVYRSIAVAEVMAEQAVAPVATDIPSVTTGMNWSSLATVAGCTGATVLISQFLKFPLDKVWKIPTRCLVYFIALVISIIAGYFTNGCLTVNDISLNFLNSFVIAAAAYGTYEVSFSKIEVKKNEDDNS